MRMVRLGVLLNPASVISLNVAPSWLQLVAESPQELALDDVIEGTEFTATKHGIISIAEIGRVSGTLSVPNKSMLVVVILGNPKGQRRSAVLSRSTAVLVGR